LEHHTVIGRRADLCEVPCGGKAAAIAPDVGEHAVAPFVLQSLQRPRERLRVIHEQTSPILGTREP
jgi:hypothetical protein